MSRKLVAPLVFLLTVLLAWLAVEFMPQTLHFAVIRFRTPDGLEMHFVKYGRGADACATTLAESQGPLTRICATCVVEAQCRRGLDGIERDILSSVPLGQPSVRFAGGVVAISAQQPALAETTCRQTASAMAQQPGLRGARCDLAGVARP